MNGLTVSDLIEELQNYDDDTPVVFAYNYGDHWQTTVAQEVETVIPGETVWSEYHRSPKVVTQESRDRGYIKDDEEVKEVIILCTSTIGWDI